MSSTTDILIKAKALVTKGWIQHEFHTQIDGVECYCVRGAIVATVRDLNVPGYAAIECFSQAIGTECVAAWNDEEGRAQTEVIEMFDKAIEISKNKDLYLT